MYLFLFIIVGSDVSILKSQFPELIFNLPDYWWVTDNNYNIHQESNESINNRINNFKDYLYNRKEDNIVVVGHSHFFSKIINKRLDNCEIYKYILE